MSSNLAAPTTPRAALTAPILRMSPLYAATLQAFQDRDWHFREVASREVVEADFEAHHTKVPLHVQVFGDARMASVVARASFPFPASHRTRVAELLMRVNQQLTLGNFEMDWDGGGIFFRVTNIFAVGQNNGEILAALVHAAIAEMDRLTPFLGELCRTPSHNLALFDIPALLAREDLLPPLPADG